MTALNYLHDEADAKRHRDANQARRARRNKRRHHRIEVHQKKQEAAALKRVGQTPPPQTFKAGTSGKKKKNHHPHKNAPAKFTPHPAYHPGMRGDEFYRTREWMEARYTTIRTYGPICMCCRASTGPMHVDHIRPRSSFPTLELVLTNLQVLCEACNIGKGNTDYTNWRNEGAIIQPG